MVGVAGFKPTTSPTPRVRANQAALYSEINRILYFQPYNNVKARL